MQFLWTGRIPRALAKLSEDSEALVTAEVDVPRAEVCS